MDFMNGFMDPKTQALLAMSGGLLSAGARSPRPVSTGQALGQGILSGLQGYQQGVQTQRNEAMYQMQLEKMAREKKQQEALAALFGPQASQPQQQQPSGETPAGMSANTSQSLFGTPEFAYEPQKPTPAPAQSGPTLSQLGGLAATGYNVEPLLKLYDMMNPKVDWQGGVARDPRSGLPIPNVPAVPQISNGYAYDPSKLQPGQFLPQIDRQDLGGSIRTLRRNADGTESVVSDTPKTGAPASLPFWLSRGPNGQSQIDPVAFGGEQGLRRAGASQVNVSTEKKYGEALAGKLADADISMRDTAMKAPDLADRANRVQQVIASGKVITGTGADYRLALGKALNLVGASDAETISNTEQLAGSLAQNTLDAIKASGLGSGSGFSNADRDFLEKAVGGKITLEATTIKRLADLSYKAAQKSAERWNTRAGQIPKSAIEGTGLDVSPVSVPPAFGNSRATDRPLDPRTKALLDRYAPQR